MARRRKPGEPAQAPKSAKAQSLKPEPKRFSKKPKAVVRDYVKERWYGNN